MDGDTIVMLIALPLVGLLVLALTVGGVLVVRDTIRQRGKWGINTKPVHCPRCGERAPVVRTPKNWQQTLWGGCTCAKCGVDYDKWGRAVDGTDGVTRRDERDDGPETRSEPRHA
jgi:hypothetical protein